MTTDNTLGDLLELSLFAFKGKPKFTKHKIEIYEKTKAVAFLKDRFYTSEFAPSYNNKQCKLSLVAMKV